MLKKDNLSKPQVNIRTSTGALVVDMSNSPKTSTGKSRPLQLHPPPNPYANYCAALEFSGVGSYSKERSCSFFRAGKCKFGDQCRFSHANAEPEMESFGRSFGNDGHNRFANDDEDDDEKEDTGVTELVLDKSPSIGTQKNTPSSAQSSPWLSVHGSAATSHMNRSKPQRALTMSDIELLSVVGTGMMAKVHQVRLKRTGAIYAMKAIHKQKVLELDAVAATQLEREVMTMQPSHPFVARLHYAFQTPAKLYLLMDFLPGGDLGFHLNNVGVFSEDMARFYCAEIILALGHLHEQGIAYRDLKADNTLIDVDGHIRLSDFGLAKRLDNPPGLRNADTDGTLASRGRSHSFCGTSRYMSPEMVDEANEHEHDYGVDMWALGILFFRMLIGEYPFEGDDPEEVREEVRQHGLLALESTDATSLLLDCFPVEELPQPISRAARSLICGLLEPNKAKRLTSKTVREHEFFREFEWNALAAKAIRPPWVPSSEYGLEDTTNFPSDFTSVTPQDSYVESVAASSMFDKFNFAGISPGSLRPHAGSFGRSPNAVDPKTQRYVMDSSADLHTGSTDEESADGRASSNLRNNHSSLPPPDEQVDIFEGDFEL